MGLRRKEPGTDLILPGQRAPRQPPRREIEQVKVVGEVLDSVTITIKQIGTTGVWRLYTVGEGRADLQPISDRQHGQGICGGTFEQAIRDAERIAQSNGFFFQRPSRLLLP